MYITCPAGTSYDRTHLPTPYKLSNFRLISDLIWKEKNFTPSIERWREYLTDKKEHHREVIETLDYVNIISMVSRIMAPLPLNHCRHIETWTNLLLGDLVVNTTYPCIELGEMEWIDDPSEMSTIINRLGTAKDVSISDSYPSRFGTMDTDCRIFPSPGTFQLFHADSVDKHRVYINRKIGNYGDRTEWDCRKQCQMDHREDMLLWTNMCKINSKCDICIKDCSTIWDQRLTITYLPYSALRPLGMDDPDQKRAWSTMKEKACYAFGKIHVKAGVASGDRGPWRKGYIQSYG
jgi:hypothetical protein